MKYTRIQVYRKIRESIPISKKHMSICGILSILVSCSKVVSPYLYKKLVDDVMLQGNIRLLCSLIPLMVGAYLVTVILQAFSTYQNKKFMHHILLQTKMQLMKKLLQRNMLEMDRGDVGEQSTVLEKDSGVVHTFLANHIVAYGTAVLSGIFYLVFMFRIHFGLMSVSMLLFPVSYWFACKIGEKENQALKTLHEVKSTTKTHLFETMQKWREIKSNTLEKIFIDCYEQRLEPERKVNNQWIFYYALNDLYYMIKEEFLLRILMYFLGGLAIIVKEITVGELLMFIGYMESMSRSLDTVLKSKSGFVSQKAAFGRLFLILDEPIRTKKTEFPEKADIKIENLDFSYEASSQKVFCNLNGCFLSGKKYLLTGKSGEGKSTLIKLLSGTVYPQKGRIWLGKHLHEEIDTRSFHKNIGIIMQEPVLFNLSIRENLLLVKPHASEEILWNALKKARIDQFVMSLPDQLNTAIGERGVKLSGGQKQRLAIARLILKNPQIVILDEATSALDSVVEGEIIENLIKQFHDHTMLVISHKSLEQYKPDFICQIKEQNMICKEA